MERLEPTSYWSRAVNNSPDTFGHDAPGKTRKESERVEYGAHFEHTAYVELCTQDAWLPATRCLLSLHVPSTRNVELYPKSTIRSKSNVLYDSDVDHEFGMFKTTKGQLLKVSKTIRSIMFP